jgi:hypothetical protein
MSGYYFAGFTSPAYTQVPDAVFDELIPNLTESELRVLLYIVRRTFGFKKTSDAISVNQMVGGLVTRDGRRLDHGTGLSRSAVWRGANGLVKKGLLTVNRVKNEDGEYETNIYALRFADEETVSPGEMGASLQESIQETDEQGGGRRQRGSLPGQAEDGLLLRGAGGRGGAARGAG